MRFDYKRFTRQFFIALFRSEKHGVKLTPTRIFLLFLFGVLLVPGVWVISHLGWLLDRLLYPRYQQQSIHEPVFIIGNPRSGTTFMHRMLAKDADKFIHLRTWEMAFAPSITQRRFFQALSRLDDAIGGPLRRILEWVDERTFGQVDYHKAGLWQAEEDEVLLLHVWNSTFQLAVFPYPDEVLRPLLDFDHHPADRERVMAFYHEALLRHLHVRQKRPSQRFLSKNPVFSSRVDALAETFPDARFIYLIRSPLDVLGSIASAANTVWDEFQGAERPFPFYEVIWDTVHTWYRYTLDWIDNAPPERVMIVNFDELTNDPKRVVTGIYAHFGFELDDAYAQILVEETIKARQYESTHTYSLEDTPFTYERIMTEYADLFERFDFDRQQPAPTDVSSGAGAATATHAP